MPRYRLNVDFDNSIEEFLYNGTGEYTFTVPATPNFDSTRYLVYLPAVLYLKDASKLPAITSYTRVEGRVPSTAEFRTIAAAQWDTLLLKDAIEFPAASAGATLTMTGYYTVGSTIDPADIMDLTNAQTKNGVVTFADGASGIKDLGTAGSVIRTKIISIGDWNMDSTESITRAHELTLSKIIRISAWIIRDTSDYKYLINYSETSGVSAGHIIVNATDIILWRFTSGFFDNSSYDSTSFNRGHIVIDYID